MRTEAQKEAHRKAMKDWRDANPERMKEYRDLNRPSFLLSVNRSAAKRDGYAPFAVADADELRAWLDEQPKHCRVCLRDDRRLCVDHCHLTGRLRGLLCTHCNRLTGIVEKYGATLTAIASYLGVETTLGPIGSPSLANLVRKILQGSEVEGRLNPSFRTALIRALADYDRIPRILNEDMEFERPVIEGHLRCGHCGRPFCPKRVTQVYCQPKCRIDAANRRNNGKRPMGVGRTLRPWPG